MSALFASIAITAVEQKKPEKLANDWGRGVAAGFLPVEQMGNLDEQVLPIQCAVLGRGNPENWDFPTNLPA